jgi:hypothetical protein
LASGLSRNPIAFDLDQIRGSTGVDNLPAPEDEAAHADRIRRSMNGIAPSGIAPEATGPRM